MCGLVGMAGDLSSDLRRVMKDLLFFDTLRGKDSTGVAAVARNRDVTTKKLTVPGYEYIEYPFVDNMLKTTDQIWIGHNRFKTMGEVSKFNAHPFSVLNEEERITLVGAHNGTLSNKFDIEKDLKERFGTDSEALFNLLVEEGDYKKAINKLRGAWSLVWWDAPENTIHFCRNKERPLFYAFTKNKKVIIWASEAWMIQVACFRNNVELLENDRGIAYHSTIPDRLYSIEIPQKCGVALPDLKTEGGYEGAPAPKTFPQKGGWSPWYEDDADDNIRYLNNRSQKQEAKEKGTTSKEKTEKDEEEDLKKLKGYKGEHLNQQEFEELKRAGCVWCGDIINNQGFGFLSDKEIVCGHCLAGTHNHGERVQHEPSDEVQRILDAAAGKAAQKAVG